MPITVELQDMHSYSLVMPIIAGIVGAIIIGTIVAIVVMKKMK